MFGLHLREKTPEAPFRLTDVLCSNDGFKTCKFADLTMFKDGRFCVLHHFTNMNGQEFNESYDKNVVFDFNNRETGAQLVEGNDKIIVIGDWWICGNVTSTVGQDGNLQITSYYDIVVDFLSNMDREYCTKRKKTFQEYVVHTDPEQVELKKFPVKRGLTTKAVAKMAYRNSTKLKIAMSKFQGLLERVQKVTRILGIVCAIAAVIYSVLLYKDVITLFGDGALFSIQQQSQGMTIFAVVCVLLTVASSIFSGGLLGVLHIVGSAASVSAVATQDEEAMTIDETSGTLSLISGIFQLIFIFAPYIFAFFLIAYLPIIPILLGSSEKINALGEQY